MLCKAVAGGRRRCRSARQGPCRRRRRTGSASGFRRLLPIPWFRMKRKPRGRRADLPAALQVPGQRDEKGYDHKRMRGLERQRMPRSSRPSPPRWHRRAARGCPSSSRRWSSPPCRPDLVIRQPVHSRSPVWTKRPRLAPGADGIYCSAAVTQPRRHRRPWWSRRPARLPGVGGWQPARPWRHRPCRRRRSGWHHDLVLHRQGEDKVLQQFALVRAFRDVARADVGIDHGATKVGPKKSSPQ